MINAIVVAIGIGTIAPIVNEFFQLAKDDQGILVKSLELSIKFLPFEDNLINVLVFFLTITILVEALGYLIHFLIMRLRSLLESEWTQKVYAKVLNLPYSYFIDKKRTDLNHLTTISTLKIRDLVEIFFLATVILQAIAIFILLFSISIQLTLFALAAGILFYSLTFFIIHKPVTSLSKRHKKANQRQTQLISEIVQGSQSFKVFNASELWFRKFSRSTENFTKASFYQAIIKFVPNTLLGLSFIIAFGASVVFLQSSEKKEFVNYIPILAVFFLSFRKLLTSTSTIGISLQNIISALPYIKPVKEFLEVDSSNYCTTSNKSIHYLDSGIRFKNVCYTYPQRQKTISDVSFCIEAKKITAMVGSSGSGKSTLIDLLLRLQEFQSGEILIDGKDLRSFNKESLYESISVVHQEPFIFHDTIENNIRLGKLGATSKEVQKAAQLAYAHDFIIKQKNGYQTVIGNRGLKLSGGQRQRLALARAIIRNPKLLILDEATSALDTHSEAIIQNTLKTLRGNCTQLVIAHRLSTIQNADKIIVIDDGKIAEIGNHSSLMKNKSVYYDLYRSELSNQ